METILTELRAFKLADHEPVCPVVIERSINKALQALGNPKIRRTAFEVISTCMQYSPNESNALLVKVLEGLMKTCLKDDILKAILTLFDAPSKIKEAIVDDPRCLCLYILEALQQSMQQFFMEKLLQDDVSHLSLEENIFISIKIAVQIIQNKGEKLFHAAFKDDSHLTWEKSWLESITSNLFSIIKCAVFQKETLSITGILLAHIANGIPSGDQSHILISFLMQMTTNTEMTFSGSKLSLSPLKISFNGDCKDVSRINKVAIFNGMLTVCSPEILLCRISIQKGSNFVNDTLLKHIFNVLYEICSKSMEPQLKYFSFQVMSAWMDTVSKVTLEKYHSKKDTDSIFMSKSNVCDMLLELVWDNRDDMIEGIPKLATSIFGKLIDLHIAESVALGGEFSNDQLILSVTKRLLADPWYIRGKYSLLCEVLRHVCPSKILEIDANFPSSLCKCYGASSLVSAANECYKSFITSQRRNSDKMAMDWNVKNWTSTFLKEFLTMLINNNARSTESCALYFIPTTLHYIPGTFTPLKDAILVEIHKEFSQNQQSIFEWHKRRTCLCYGYCAVLKLGRKLGIASFVDVDLHLLQECLRHNDDSLRAEAFSVLCYNNKTTEPLSDEERSMVIDFLHVNLNCSSSSFRQTLFVSMKNLMARIRDSCVMLRRDFLATQKKTMLKDPSRTMPDTLSSSIDLVDNIVSLSLRALFPGASFQRKKTGLQLLFSVFETFSSTKDAVKRGRTAESLKTLTDWVKSTGKWKFICTRNLRILISCLEDQHDEVRELALDISKWFPQDALDMTPTERKEFIDDLMKQANFFSTSPRIRDAESGAVLFQFLCQRFLSWESSSIFEVQTFGNSMPGYVCNFDSSSGIVHVIIHLLHTIELQIQQAYDDLLGAALRQPVFGFIITARRCFSAFMKHLSMHGKSIEGIEKYIGNLIRVVETAVNVCKRATEMALSVFADHDKGGSPSFADMNLALENAMKRCNSLKHLEESIGYQHCLELISSFCWLNVKAATLFLGEIGQLFTLDCLRLSQKNEIFSDEMFNEVGKVFRETLVNCRHKGVIENSCVGFQKLCRSVIAIPSKAKLLNDWLIETIDAVDRNDLNSSVTKRSAGLPMFVQPIVSACIKSPRFQFELFIKSLIQIANRPVSTNGQEQSDLPQVQSMNILKAIFRDSSIGSEVLKYAEDGLILSIDGFISHSWLIRNAAHILLGALVPRMLGQRVTQAEKSHHNSLTASKFFKMYPKVLNFFVDRLQSGVNGAKQLTNLPGLIPILTILTKLRPCNDINLQSKLYPLLQCLMFCPVFTIRKLAACSLSLFMPVGAIKTYTETWIEGIKYHSPNANHGFLLMVKRILEMKQDDTHYAECITVEMLLRISKGVLQMESQPLLYCTLLEIYENLLPSLYEDSCKESSACKEEVRDVLVKILGVVDGSSVGNELLLGAHLVPKRLAQTSLGFIAKEQQIDSDFPDRMITGLLSSKHEPLVSETAAEVTSYLNLGSALKDSLRLKIYDHIKDRLSLSENISLNINCIACCVDILSSAEDLGVILETKQDFFQYSKTLFNEGGPHARIAVVLPFIGLILKSYFKSGSLASISSNNVIELLDIWSERVLAYSSANEREILRLSSLKSIQVAASSLFQHYDETNSKTDLFREDLVARLCSRLVFALLNLIQDEDESIRNAACDLTAVFQHSSETKPTPKLQSNLAIVVVFQFIKDKMMGNLPLIQSLYQQLKNLFNVSIKNLTRSRAAYLFEQESANLFAEDYMFAKWIVDCLQVIGLPPNDSGLNVPCTDRHDSILKELSTMCENTLKIICGMHDAVSNLWNHEFCGKQRVVLALDICLGVLCLIKSFSIDQNNDSFIQFLLKAKTNTYLNSIFEDQIGTAFTLIGFTEKIQLKTEQTDRVL